MTLTVLVLVLWLLALARATRVVNFDEITDPFRIWVMTRTGVESSWSYLVQCPWCVSFWLGIATAPFAIWITDLSWWLWPLLALAGSQVTGMLANLGGGGDDVEVVVEDD